MANTGVADGLHAGVGASSGVGAAATADHVAGRGSRREPCQSFWVGVRNVGDVYAVRYSLHVARFRVLRPVPACAGDVSGG